MTTQKTIIRKAREHSTRSLLDISSKVKAAALAAAGTDLTAAGAYLHGDLGAHALLGVAVASLVPVIAAYAKTSTEAVEEHVDEVATVAHEIAPVVEAVAPAAEPVVEATLSGVDAVQAMLDESVPASPEATPVVEAPATTATIALSAPRPATAGGQ